MTVWLWENVIGGVIGFGLLFLLAFVLLNPEGRK